MGFFRRLFGAKKAGTHSSSKEKRRWNFTSRSSSKQTTPSQSQSQPQSLPQATKPDASYEANLDANKHAIAVAAATAAVAEAALAAAHAAAEVVRLTSTGGRGGGVAAPPGAHFRWQHELAAVRIQSAFRGYLVSNLITSIYFLSIKIYFFIFFKFSGRLVCFLRKRRTKKEKSCKFWILDTVTSLFLNLVYQDIFFFKFSGQLVCFLRKRRKRKKNLQILNTGYCYFFVSQPHLKVQKFEFRVLLFLCFSVSFSAIWDRKSKAKTFFFHEKKESYFLTLEDSFVLLFIL